MEKLKCALCGWPVPDRREHILPTWFLKTYDGHGPYTIERNGVPIRYRSGESKRPGVERVMLPVCGTRENARGAPGCNGLLDKRFEHPAKPAVRALLEDNMLTGGAVEAAARWIVKTLLLLAHPDAQYSETKSTERQRWKNMEELLSGLGTTGVLPPHLSLWAAVVNRRAEGGPDTPSNVIMLPQIMGETAQAQLTTRTFGMADGRELAFQLLHHPHYDVRHPFEEAGLAVRLWPDPPAEFLPSAMPTLDRTGWQCLTRTFCMGGVRQDLRSLQAGVHSSPFITAH